MSIASALDLLLSHPLVLGTMMTNASMLVADLIEKLNRKGRQLDAVKFVYALNAVDIFPPIPLLKAYITESKKMAHGVRKKGNNSLQAQVCANSNCAPLSWSCALYLNVHFGI